jgi:hypothetical protein
LRLVRREHLCHRLSYLGKRRKCGTLGGYTTRTFTGRLDGCVQFHSNVAAQLDLTGIGVILRFIGV